MVDKQSRLLKLKYAGKLINKRNCTYIITGAFPFKLHFCRIIKKLILYNLVLILYFLYFFEDYDFCLKFEIYRCIVANFDL